MIIVSVSLNFVPAIPIYKTSSLSEDTVALYIVLAEMPFLSIGMSAVVYNGMSL